MLQRCVFTGRGRPDVGVQHYEYPAYTVKLRLAQSHLWQTTGKQISSPVSGEEETQTDGPYITDAIWESYRKLTVGQLQRKVCH